ncbi:MAG: nuclear transport factor 2 family protein [Paracoccaceae bacterium]
MTQPKIEFLKDWFQKVWVEGDMAAIDDYFAPRAGADGLMPDGEVGVEDFRALVPALSALVRDLNFTIDQHLEGPDWLWAQFTTHAMAAHEAREIAAKGQIMMRFDGDKISEAYNVFDFLTLFSQAGLLPEEAFLLLLSGDRLG